MLIRPKAVILTVTLTLCFCYLGAAYCQFMDMLFESKLVYLMQFIFFLTEGGIFNSVF